MENNNPPFPPNPQFPQNPQNPNPQFPPPQQPGNPFFNNPMGGGQIDVPNATVVLVLGICSIVVCFLQPILGVIALVLSGSAKKAYDANPSMYKEASFKNLQAGRICAIIGIALGVLVWAYYIWLWFFWTSALNDLSRFNYHY